MHPFPCLRKTLTLLTLLGVAAAHAQPLVPVNQSPLNYKHYLGIVVKQHPSVQAAQSQIESAKQDVDGAKWQFMPTPSIGAEKSSKAADGLTDRRTTFARLQQPLWTGGRLTAQLDRAQSQETVAHLSLDEQRLTLAARWLQLWAEVQAGELKVEAYEDSEKQHIKYVEQVRNRANGGQAPSSDIQLSLSRLAAVQAELEQARAQKRQAISKIEQMYGVSFPSASIQWSAPLRAQASTPLNKLYSADQWVTKAQEKHPSLQKAIAVTSTVRADVALAKSKAYPELYVRGEVLNGDVSKTTRQIYFGVTSSFGAGLSSLSSIAAAQARLDAQEHETELRRREITDQVLNDVQTLESQQQRVQYLEQATASADLFLKSSERLFESGRKSWQELMNTAREKAQTLTQLADAQTLQWLAHQRLVLLADGLDPYLQETAPSQK